MNKMLFLRSIKLAASRERVLRMTMGLITFAKTKVSPAESLS